MADAAPELSARLKALHASAEAIAGRAFVPLLDFDSGPRYGLVATADGGGEHACWAVASAATLVLFDSERARAFVELLEYPRRQVEAQIEERARRAALPPAETAWSLPAVPLIAAMLRGSSQHFARLGLSWILPSELRELRDAIRACAENRAFPEAVRGQAQRLVVKD